MPTRTPRPEVLALLRECKQNVWDDTPRLVLADWLLDHGDESERALGEVMHSQVRRTIWPWRHYFSGTVPNPACEQALIDAHRSRWVRPHPAYNWGLGRGLFRIESQGVLMEDLLDAILLPEGIEWVETIGFSTGIRDEQWKRLGVSPVIENLGILDLGGSESWGRDEHWQRFFGSSYLDRLSGLRLATTPAWDPFRLFLTAGNLAGLRLLDLSRTTIDEQALSMFLDSPILEQLTSLNLNHALVESRELLHFARSPRTRNLRDLFLSVRAPTDSALAALFGSPYLTSLRRLDLQPGGTVSATHVDALVNSSLSLSYLALGQQVARDAIVKLISSPWVSRLRYLTLPTPIGLKEATAIVQSPHLDGLQAIKLCCYQKPEKTSEILRDRFGERWLV